MSKPKIIIVAGPTASGKSALALKLARKYNGEIVSADSRQVYRGLDIGTAKLTKKEMAGIVHHCIDIANPRTFYSVAQYQKTALTAIDIILNRGKTPIIIGGTGFYIHAIVYDSTFPAVPPNQKLRVSLGSRTTKSLFAMLKKLDPVRAENIDAQNPRRLIRAIEIIKKLGHVPTQTKKERFDVKYIFLNPSKAVLQKNIARRTKAMLRRGLIAETQKLLKQKIPRARIQELGFEYWLPLEYLEGNLSKQDLEQKLNAETWHYARRQITWFKKYSPHRGIW